VRVLFVAESAPAGGTFFYAGDSGLFRATRDAFCDAFDRFDEDEPFLERFARAGCYLVDLCPQPVNRLTHGRRAAHRAGEGELARTIADLQPLVIVVLLKSIAPNVRRAAAAAGCAHVECHEVTYPSRWHRHRIAFRGELAALLRGLARRGMLTGLEPVSRSG
jgi:hypothetical protein